MTLIKIKVDASTEVTASGWANPNHRKAGDKTPDGFQVYDIADDEIAKLVVSHTKLTGGHLVVDSDYVPPVEPTETAPQPSQQDQINAQLLKQTAANAAANAAIVKQLATITAAGTDTNKEAE